MIAIVDYGVGNLFSLQSSFAYIGQEAVVTNEERAILCADHILLPGVGAFADAIEKLRNTGLDRVVCRAAKEGTPLLGVCLGMQLLFEQSEEYGLHEGLGLIRGRVRPIPVADEKKYKIPQIGWNALEKTAEHPLLKDVQNGECVYFVHSYHAEDCDEDTIAVCEYGTRVTAAVAHGNICGTQFHPEKSGEVGMKILRAFCAMQKGGRVC